MTRLRQLELETSWGPLVVAGGSRAGEGTLVLLPQLRLALEGGRPHRALPPMSTLLVSHGHADHLGGLAYWASQRFLNTMGRGILLAPEAIADDLIALLELHARLEGGRPYQVEVVRLRDGERHKLRPDMILVPFGTDHWVPTLGARLLWRKHRLRRELAGLPRDEIARRARAGEPVRESVETALLAYCADTGPGLFSGHPEALDAEVVLLECSFFRASDRERARSFGHLHVDDLAEVADRLRCRHLVLLHASRRHRLRDVEEYLDALRPHIEARLDHLVVDWD